MLKAFDAPARRIRCTALGDGRPEDTTARGRGVVVDTIEIQDVRVLSEKVFANLQARYRAAAAGAAASAAHVRRSTAAARLRPDPVHRLRGPLADLGRGAPAARSTAWAKGFLPSACPLP